MMVEMTSELSEICGIHAGDGYMRLRERSKGEVDISGHIEEKDYYDAHVIPLFNQVFGLDIKGKHFSRGSYGFVSYKQEIRETLVSLGFPLGKKSKSVKVPDFILKSGDFKIYGAFLRGLFDTDGNLSFRKSYEGINKFNKHYNHYPTLKIVTISKDLAEGVIKLLHELDIVFNYHCQDSKKPNENRNYIITISGIDGLDRWMNFVGMKNSVKLTRYLIWKKFGFCPTKTNLGQREDILNGRLDLYNIKGP
jgi:intein/homing endonuclease